MKKLLSFFFAFAFFAIANSASAATVYVDASASGANNGSTPADAYTSIQTAIDNSTDGDVIQIADGTYTISATIEVTKSVTLQGTSQAGTIINASGATGGFGKFGIHSSKSNITFNDFTLTAPAGSGGRGFKLEGTTTNTSGLAQDGSRSANVSINRVTVNGDGGTSSRTGIDFNGINNVSLTDVTSANNGGNGISLTDCSNVTMTNITTSGNKWGGVALYTKGQYYPGGISGVTITNLNSSESNPLYNQNEGTFNSGAPFATSGLSAPQFTYSGTNNLNSDSSTYVWYNSDKSALASWITAVTSDTAHTKVVEISSGSIILVSGQTIQNLIDNANPGDTIYVPAGSYTENLTINKSINLIGANGNINPVNSFRSAESSLTGSILITSSNVKVDGMEITNPSYSGPSIKGIQIYSSGPTISDITISNNYIHDIDNANTKGAYGVMVQADVSNVAITSNKIDSISSSGWARGIEVTAGCNVTNVPASVTITGNSITNISVASGSDVYVLSIDWCDSPVQIADASQVKVEDNIFDSTKVKNLDTTHHLELKKNYWGTNNPSFTGYSGSVNFGPWCLTSDCTIVWTQPGASDWASKPASISGSTSTMSTTTTSSTTSTSTSLFQSVGSTSSSSVPQVLGESVYKFVADLGYGSRGDAVSELQKILLAQKFLVLKTGLPTGWFGPLTRAALIKWQVAHNLPATGFFGKLSRDVMNGAI